MLLGGCRMPGRGYDGDARLAGPLHQRRAVEDERTAGLDGDRFTRTELSTGQRKRLALVAALLEAKPILVLDEWAADQDPHFRRKFYDELLPRMKAAGKTIIAVTHDERYFHIADRHFHMEEGQLRDLTENLANG